MMLCLWRWCSHNDTTILCVFVCVCEWNSKFLQYLLWEWEAWAPFCKNHKDSHTMYTHCCVCLYAYGTNDNMIHIVRVSKVEIEIEIISKNLDLVSISNLEIWNSRSRLSKILKPHIFGKFCIEFFEFLIDFDKLSTYSSIIVNMKQISSIKTLNLYFVGSSKWFLFVIFNNGSLLIF